MLLLMMSPYPLLNKPSQVQYMRLINLRHCKDNNNNNNPRIRLRLHHRLKLNHNLSTRGSLSTVIMIKDF